MIKRTAIIAATFGSLIAGALIVSYKGEGEAGPPDTLDAVLDAGVPLSDGGDSECPPNFTKNLSGVCVVSE
jgi:hypothetical protein